MSRVVFMGTPEFAVPSLRQAASSHTVVGVITQPDRPAGRGRKVKESPIKVAARELGIPVSQPESFRSSAPLAQLRKWQPDVIVVAAYGQILPQEVLDLPIQGCINVHASLLPRWRGAAPIQHAILAGDHKTGISLMKMDAGMDTGPVYVRESIDIEPLDTAADLHDRLAYLGGEVLASYLDPILMGELQPEAQDESKATYAPQIKREDGLIEWTQKSGTIDRLIRAMFPWPGAHDYWKGRHFKIISSQPFESKGLPRGEPGSIKKVDGDVIVLAGDGAISLLQVQLAGKRVTAIEDFTRGQSDFIGSSFDNLIE